MEYCLHFPFLLAMQRSTITVGIMPVESTEEKKPTTSGSLNKPFAPVEFSFHANMAETGAN